MSDIDKIHAMVEPIVTKNDLLLYGIEWAQEGSMRILRIAIMRQDGSMDIDTCAVVSEQISEVLDEDDIIQQDYFLEVCSPGAERELRTKEDVLDQVGSHVHVELKDPQKGINEVTGTLTSFEGDVVFMQYMDKAVKKKIEIAYENISLIRLAVKI